MGAFRTDGLVSSMTVHDALQDGGEGCHTDTGADEDGVLGAEDLAGRCAVGTVDVDGHMESANRLTADRLALLVKDGLLELVGEGLQRDGGLVSGSLDTSTVLLVVLKVGV